VKNAAVFQLTVLVTLVPLVGHWVKHVKAPVESSRALIRIHLMLSGSSPLEAAWPAIWMVSCAIPPPLMETMFPQEGVSHCLMLETDAEVVADAGTSAIPDAQVTVAAMIAIRRMVRFI
jgi:hypothetical protein